MPYRRPFVLVLALLTGCAVQKPQIIAPEAGLLADCPAPKYDKTTNIGLARGIQAYHAALQQCSADKAALREWYKEQK